MFLFFLFWILGPLIFISNQSTFGIVLAFFFYGLDRGALEATQKTFLSELSPLEYKAKGSEISKYKEKYN